MRHEYDALQFPTLWSIILHELGPLEPACILALKDLPDDERVG